MFWIAAKFDHAKMVERHALRNWANQRSKCQAVSLPVLPAHRGLPVTLRGHKALPNTAGRRITTILLRAVRLEVGDHCLPVIDANPRSLKLSSAHLFALRPVKQDNRRDGRTGGERKHHPRNPVVMLSDKTDTGDGECQQNGGIENDCHCQCVGSDRSPAHQLYPCLNRWGCRDAGLSRTGVRRPGTTGGPEGLLRDLEYRYVPHTHAAMAEIGHAASFWRSASRASFVRGSSGSSPVSNRETVVWWTPSFSASCACVSPSSLRIAAMLSMKSYICAYEYVRQ